MRRFFMIPAALVAMGLVFGCGSDTADQAETAADHAADHAHDATGHEGHDHGDGGHEGHDHGTVEMAAATLEGSLGCGHCNFQAKSECSLAMKTASGDIVFIEAGDRQEDLMAQRMDQPAVTIKGKVSTVDGQKVIYADNIELN